MQQARTSYMPKYTPRAGDDCMLWYPGQTDPHSATVKDHSGEGNHGTKIGATYVQTNKGLWVRNYDGNDDVVDCGNDSSLRSATGAWECWAKPGTSMTDYSAIMMMGILGDWNSQTTIRHIDGALGLIMRVANEAPPYEWHGAAAAGTFPAGGDWAHLMLVQDGVAPKLYLNSDLVLTISSGGDLTTWTSHWNAVPKNLYIAGNSGGGYLQCQTWGERVWTRVPSIAEIKSHYQQERHLFGV